MVVLKNMDELMDLPLGPDEIAAAHACAIPANCAHTAVSHPLASPPSWSPNTPRPYGQLNSGTVVLNPSKELADSIVHYLNTEDISKFSFPDQDLLAAYFLGKWKPLSWYYNALKTLKVIHTPEWDDNEVRCLHYILHDKPWKTKGLSDGEPAYIEFNNWWWDRFDKVLAGLSTQDQELVRSTIGA
ncbi:hypothetical protein VNI00_001475 [Paramarasmius palmivorus]|uniref:Uncharacterized protein n=1 Tax=Paramarasmius palmivorus TaxID=297713 RepID=A0AAW0E4E6_9AGAR